MFIARFIMVASLSACLLPAAYAQDTPYHWQKSYSVSGQPSIMIEVSDSNLNIHSCGECRSVQIQVESKRKLNDYRLVESQSGNNISFSLKEKLHVGFHLTWHDNTPQVTVETPASLSLDARTSDGNLVVGNLRGDLRIHTGDGNADISNVDGTVHLDSGDGNFQIHNASGDLNARTSDGRMTVDGRFTSLQLHSSDGRLDVTFLDGSKLNSPSRIESSDGSVTIRVPRNFAADLDLSASDGRIDSTLPFTVDHYESGKQRLQGRLNAGGIPLVVHTSDGNISISPL